MGQSSHLASCKHAHCFSLKDGQDLISMTEALFLSRAPGRLYITTMMFVPALRVGMRADIELLENLEAKSSLCTCSR